MKKITISLAVLVLLLIGVYFYVSRNNNQEHILNENNQTTASNSVANPVLKLNTDDSVGEYITDSKGMTLYTYKNDTYNTSNCTEGCAVSWPPYVVSTQNSKLVGENISGIVNTIVRPDGKYQVTYDGMPLYYYSKDKIKGDIIGNGIGEVWSVAVQPVQTGS